MQWLFNVMAGLARWDEDGVVGEVGTRTLWL